MTKDDRVKDAYNNGVRDARSGTLLAEGSRRYKSNPKLLSVYTKGFLSGLKGGFYV